MTERGSSAARRRAVVSVLAIAAALAAPARAWCELSFAEILDRVDTVVLVEYRKPRGERASVVTLEVFKGEAKVNSAAMPPAELEEQRPRAGSRYLVALTRFGHVAREIEGLGACSPISVLPLKGDRLRAADRFDYDGGHEPMTLDALREDLRRRLGPR